MIETALHTAPKHASHPIPPVPWERKIFLHPLFSPLGFHSLLIDTVHDVTGVKATHAQAAIQQVSHSTADELYRIQGELTMRIYNAHMDENNEEPAHESYGSILLRKQRSHKHVWTDYHTKQTIYRGGDWYCAKLHFLPFGQAYPSAGFERHGAAQIFFDMIKMSRTIQTSQPDIQPYPLSVYAAYTNHRNAAFLQRSLGVHIEEYLDSIDIPSLSESARAFQQWQGQIPRARTSVLVFFTIDELLTQLPDRANAGLDRIQKHLRIDDMIAYERQLRLHALEVACTNANPLLYAVFQSLHNHRHPNERTNAHTDPAPQHARTTRETITY